MVDKHTHTRTTELTIKASFWRKSRGNALIERGSGIMRAALKRKHLRIKDLSIEAQNCAKNKAADKSEEKRLRRCNFATTTTKDEYEV